MRASRALWATAVALALGAQLALCSESLQELIAARERVVVSLRDAATARYGERCETPCTECSLDGCGRRLADDATCLQTYGTPTGCEFPGRIGSLTESTARTPAFVSHSTPGVAEAICWSHKLDPTFEANAVASSTTGLKWQYIGQVSAD